jgi:hypothetical protein
MINRDIRAGFSPTFLDFPCYLLLYTQLSPPLEVCGIPDGAEHHHVVVLLLGALSLSLHFAGYRLKVFVYLLERTRLLLFLPGTG